MCKSLIIVAQNVIDKEVCISQLMLNAVSELVTQETVVLRRWKLMFGFSLTELIRSFRHRKEIRVLAFRGLAPRNVQNIIVREYLYGGQMTLSVVDKTKQMFNTGYFDCDRLW